MCSPFNPTGSAGWSHYIHASADGTRVVNYARWESAEAFHAMLENPAAQAHMGKAADLAEAYDPHLYTVESVHHS